MQHFTVEVAEKQRCTLRASPERVKTASTSSRNYGGDSKSYHNSRAEAVMASRPGMDIRDAIAREGRQKPGGAAGSQHPNR
jgi:hypothetical protein